MLGASSSAETSVAEVNCGEASVSRPGTVKVRGTSETSGGTDSLTASGDASAVLVRSSETATVACCNRASCHASETSDEGSESSVSTLGTETVACRDAGRTAETSSEGSKASARESRAAACNGARTGGCAEVSSEGYEAPLPLAPRPSSGFRQAFSFGPKALAVLSAEAPICPSADGERSTVVFSSIRAPGV